MRSGLPPGSVYDGAAAALSAPLRRGCAIAFLCQGDRLFYGSFIEIFTRPAPRFAVEIVPGVTSPSACAAVAGAPLAAGEESLTVVPAILDEPAPADRILAADAVAIVKRGRHFASGLGLIDDAVYIERATLPGERVAPFAAVEAAAVSGFSTAIMRRRPRPG